MKLFKRNKTLTALRGRVEDQMMALWNRNQLIADQDHEIDRLRKELRSVQTSNAELIEQCTLLRGENRTLQQDITRLRDELHDVSWQRDFWQGRAANP